MKFIIALRGDDDVLATQEVDARGLRAALDAFGNNDEFAPSWMMVGDVLTITRME